MELDTALVRFAQRDNQLCYYWIFFKSLTIFTIFAANEFSFFLDDGWRGGDAIYDALSFLQ